MVGVNILAAQIDLLRQTNIGKVEWTGLDFVSGRSIQFAALQSRLHSRLRENLLLVDGWAQDLLNQIRLVVQSCRQHRGEDNVAPLRIANRIGASKANPGLLKDFPPVTLAISGGFELPGKPALRTVGDNHFRLRDGLCRIRFSRT